MKDGTIVIYVIVLFAHLLQSFCTHMSFVYSFVQLFIIMYDWPHGNDLLF